MTGRLEVRDRKTGEIFGLDPTENRAIIKTSDGEKIRVHPAAIRSMVKQGQAFDGHTLTGSRTLERTK